MKMNRYSYFLCLFLLVVLGCSAETLSDGEDIDTFVDRLITGSDVMVFAKSYCGYCRHARNLLRDLHKEHNKAWTLNILDLDEMMEDDGPLVQMELMMRTGQRTVPNIFIHGRHVGGDSDLTSLYSSGELTKMLMK